LCALRWSNIDVKNKSMSIERGIIESTGGIFEKDTKTHASRRISLDPHTLEVLEEQRRLMKERASVAGVKLDNDSYVFSREPGGHTPWTPGWATKRFAVVRDSLGYEFRLHDLRHFAATRLIAAGSPVRTVSGRLGHANPSTTLRVYSHFVEASDQDAAAIMGGLVGPRKTKASVKKNVAPVKTAAKAAKEGTASKTAPAKRASNSRSRG
jgi:integrase